MQSALRILVADDHPLFRDALRHMIDASFINVEITEVQSFAAVSLTASAEGPFDLVFLDLLMPGGSRDPLEDLRQLRAAIPDTPILVVSSLDDRATIERVIAMGAAAFVSKSASRADMERAIRSVLAGDVYGPTQRRMPEPGEALSPRQTMVLELLARGRSNRQIAQALNVEEITVKAHISAILRKLHVKSRLEAVVVSRSVLNRS